MLTAWVTTPTWPTQMVNWIKTQNVSWASYFNFDYSKRKLCHHRREVPQLAGGFPGRSERRLIPLGLAERPRSLGARSKSQGEMSQPDSATPRFRC